MNQFKYRKRNRLKGYNYSSEGLYFVTICSKDRKNIFGKINNECVGDGLTSSRDNKYVCTKLSKIGEIIDKQWQDINDQYDNVELDEYIIMPNHIHGILIIDNVYINKWEDARPSPTISDIVCSFKSKCVVEYLKYIKENNFNLSGQIWQRSFHDHIIRNDKSLNNIREYIKNNPATWDNDKENINCITKRSI